MKIEKLLTPFICEHYDIDLNESYEVEEINGCDLITSDRLDLVVKYKYLEFKNKGRDMSFAEKLYEEHIGALTNGTYIERGKEDEKNSIDKYIKEFNSIESSILERGFDQTNSVVPVARNGAIFDGAHRSSVCAYHNIPVSIVRFPEISVQNDYRFYRKRLLSEDSLDYIISEYVKMTSRPMFAICIWPRGKSKKLRSEAEKLIANNSKIVFSKEIKLNENGLRNLMIQIYKEHEWLGSVKSKFKGATNKSSLCYSAESSVQLYIVENTNLAEILKVKSAIRELFNIGNHSVHITDTNGETIQVVDLLLNKNSIEFLNSGLPDKYVNLNILVQNFKDYVTSSGYNLEDYVVDSSAVMGLFGLRPVNDLDYLSSNSGNKSLSLHNVDCHNEYIKYYERSLSDLVYNPENYLVYNEVKFITLDVLKAFKANRGERKDYQDVKLISSFKLNSWTIGNVLYRNKLLILKKIRAFKSVVKGTPIYKPLKILKWKILSCVNIR